MILKKELLLDINIHDMKYDSDKVIFEALCKYDDVEHNLSIYMTDALYTWGLSYMELDGEIFNIADNDYLKLIFEDNAGFIEKIHPIILKLLYDKNQPYFVLTEDELTENLIDSLISNNHKRATIQLKTNTQDDPNLLFEIIVNGSNISIKNDKIKIDL